MDHPRHSGLALAVGIVGIALALQGCGKVTDSNYRRTTIAELKDRVASSAGVDQAFRIRGVVTFADPLSDFFVIQDDTGGLKVSLPKGQTLAEYGQFAEVSGMFSNEGSNHSFLASDVIAIRKGQLPKAVSASDPGDLNKETFRRVSLNGIIESVKLARPGLKELFLNSDHLQLPIFAVLWAASDADSLVGGQVHLTGVVLPHSSGGRSTFEIWTPDIQNVILTRGPTPRGSKTSAQSPGRAVIRTAREVHHLRPEVAALHAPVEFRAVVTFSDARLDRLFVQDKTDGMYVQSMPGEQATLKVGDLVRIKGETSAGDFAPTVARATAAIEGAAKLPRPESDIEAIFMGQRDSRWVRLHGVVQDAKESRGGVLLNLVWGKHRFKAHVLAPPDDVKSLIDRRVTIEGACGSIFNNRRQVLGIQLFVPSMRFITPESAVVADPYLLPIRPAAALLQFSSDDNFIHRSHIRGVVSLSNPSGPTWIRDASAALVITTHDPVTLRNGDVVDVIGFPSAGEYGPVLKSATIQKLRSGPAPVPIVTDADEASKGNEESQLIQLDGKLVDSFVHEGVRVLRLESGSNVFSANISALAALPRLWAGSELRLTGICSVTTDDSQGTLLARGFRLNLRSAEDIRILQGGPWLTSERLALVLSGTFALAMTALFWVVLLRRNVRKQTQTLLSKRVQLESANMLAHQALDRALETESLEQSRRLLLELIAHNEPLDRIITDIARAAEKHSRGTSCSLTISLSDGSQLTAAPAIAGKSQLSFELITNQRAVRVPIFVGDSTVGIMVMQSTDGGALSQQDQTLFASWAQFASLAIERRGLYDSLSFRAQFDAMTGLHNRASLYEKISQELVAAKRSRTMLAVLYIDLNEFKEVNDAFGHDAGDRVLREVSKRILNSVRRDDIVARLGGDEFVAVLTELPSPDGAESAAELLRANLAKPIQLDFTTVYCGASVGVAVYPSDGSDGDALMKKADRRMYRDKSVRKLAPVTV